MTLALACACAIAGAVASTALQRLVDYLRVRHIRRSKAWQAYLQAVDTYMLQLEHYQAGDLANAPIPPHHPNRK